jgi:hypothetical protein
LAIRDRRGLSSWSRSIPRRRHVVAIRCFGDGLGVPVGDRPADQFAVIDSDDRLQEEPPAGARDRGAWCCPRSSNGSVRGARGARSAEPRRNRLVGDRHDRARARARARPETAHRAFRAQIGALVAWRRVVPKELLLYGDGPWTSSRGQALSRPEQPSLSDAIVSKPRNAFGSFTLNSGCCTT